MFCSFLIENLGFTISLTIVAGLMIVFIALFFKKCERVRELEALIAEKDGLVEISMEKIQVREKDLLAQKEELEKDKIILKQGQEKLIRDNDSLNNAMRLFKQQKEAHENLNNKSEKDIAIDLYLKFIDLESTFTFFQTNLASVDSKLSGVKDYSEDLAAMKADLLKSNNIVIKQMSLNKDAVNAEMVDVKNAVIKELDNNKTEVINDLNNNRSEVISKITNSQNQVLDTYSKASTEIQAIKNEMISLQKMYSEELKNILLSLKAFLSDVQTNIQNIITECFDSESKKYFTEMYRFAGTIDQKINQFNDAIVNIVDGRLESVCTNIENKTITNVQTAVSAYISQYDNHISDFKNHAANIAERMVAFNNAFDSKFNNLRKIIEESYDTSSFSQTISEAVERGVEDADISYSVSSGVDSAISSLDIPSKVEEAFESYTVTDKIKDSAKDGMEDCINNYSFRSVIENVIEDCLGSNLEYKIRSAIDYEIGSTLSQIESDVSDIKSKTDYM